MSNPFHSQLSRKVFVVFAMLLWGGVACKTSQGQTADRNPVALADSDGGHYKYILQVTGMS